MVEFSQWHATLLVLILRAWVWPLASSSSQRGFVWSLSGYHLAGHLAGHLVGGGFWLAAVCLAPGVFVRARSERAAAIVRNLLGVHVLKLGHGAAWEIEAYRRPNHGSRSIIVAVSTRRRAFLGTISGFAAGFVVVALLHNYPKDQVTRHRYCQLCAEYEETYREGVILGARTDDKSRFGGPLHRLLVQSGPEHRTPNQPPWPRYVMRWAA